MALCPRFYVKLDGLGYPIPSTMQSYNPKFNNPPCSTTGCAFAILQTSSYSAPPDTHQCIHPEGLRFFYSLDKAGHIVPNSLISTLEYPNRPGTCSYMLEWKKYCINE